MTPWTAARQACLSITNSKTLLRLMSIELVMPSNHLILCHPLLLLSSIFPRIRVSSNESVLCITGSKYWSFSFSINPSNRYSRLIAFRMDWLDWLQSKGLSVVFSNTNFCIYNCTSPFVWSSLTSDAWHSYPTYWVDIRIQAYTYMGNVIKQTGFFFPILC